MSLGTAFEDLSRGPGMAYFPAISLSFKESVAFNFGSRPLRYPFGEEGCGAAWKVLGKLRWGLPAPGALWAVGGLWLSQGVSRVQRWWVPRTAVPAAPL